MGLQWHTRQFIANCLENREPFIRGNLAGIRTMPGVWHEYGIMPEPYKSELKAIVDEREVYVVFSWKTPIAYFDGEWTIPDVYYSPTTKHHQSVIRVAISTKCYQYHHKW